MVRKKLVLLSVATYRFGALARTWRALGFRHVFALLAVRVGRAVAVRGCLWRRPVASDLLPLVPEVP